MSKLDVLLNKDDVDILIKILSILKLDYHVTKDSKKKLLILSYKKLVNRLKREVSYD